MKSALLLLCSIMLFAFPSMAEDQICTSEVSPDDCPVWCKPKYVRRELPSAAHESFEKVSLEILDSVGAKLPTQYQSDSCCVFKISEDDKVTDCFFWSSARKSRQSDEVLIKAIQQASLPKDIPADIKSNWMKIDSNRGDLTLFVDFYRNSNFKEREAYFAAVKAQIRTGLKHKFATQLVMMAFFE
jgi:hypothetical protein